MLKRVEVIIVSWNARELIRTCIDHVARNTNYLNYGLSVIDNASSDGTPDIVSAAGVPVTRLEINEGWVGALNFALGTIKADYYFFLNPDAFVQPGWLSPLVSELNANESAGVVAPKFINKDGTIQSAGYRMSSNLHFEAIGAGEVDRGQYDQPRFVPFCGGMMLLRREVFEDIGPFDTLYGLGYYEDSDYQLRARRRGWQVRYAPGSRIVHLGAETFGRAKHRMERILTENRLRFMTVHYPLRWLARRVAIEATRPIRAPFRRESPFPFLAGTWGWLKTLPEALRRRAHVAELGPAPSLEDLQRPRDY